MQPRDAERRDSWSASVSKTTRSGVAATRWTQSEQAAPCSRSGCTPLPHDGTPMGSAVTLVLGGRMTQARPQRAHAWAACRNHVVVRGGSPAGEGSAPAALLPIRSVRIPTGGRGFFLTVWPVSKSLLPCKFSTTKIAHLGGLCTYKASVCQNLFWQQEAELYCSLRNGGFRFHNILRLRDTDIVFHSTSMSLRGFYR